MEFEAIYRLGFIEGITIGAFVVLVVWYMGESVREYMSNKKGNI